MSKKEKINWLLILQGWAMLWVVIGHSFLGVPGKGPEWENILFRFAYSFHMPLFMLVSGWLFYLTRLKTNNINGGGGRQWLYNQIVKDKSLRLLLPGFVFSIIAFAIKIAFPGEMSRQMGLSLRDVLHAYLYPFDNPLRELWFIVTLFWLMMLFPLWKVVLKRKWSLWCMLVVLIVLHFWHTDIKFLCIGRVFNYAIWFYLGAVISKTDAVNKLIGKLPWVTLIIGVVLYVLGWYIHVFVTTFGGIVFSFGLSLILDKYFPTAFFSFRNYTYQIFLLGIFVQIAIKIAYRHFSLPYLVCFIFCVLAGLYVPVVVAKIIEKINWKPLSLCYGIKS